MMQDTGKGLGYDGEHTELQKVGRQSSFLLGLLDIWGQAAGNLVEKQGQQHKIRVEPINMAKPIVDKKNKEKVGLWVPMKNQKVSRRKLIRQLRQGFDNKEAAL